MTTVRRRASRAARPTLDIGKLADSFKRFREAVTAEASAKRERERLRDSELMPLIEQFGGTHGDHQQHLAIELPEAVDGLQRLVRRANVSRFVNVERAEAYAEKVGFLEDIQTVTLTWTFTGTPAEARSVAEAFHEEHTLQSGGEPVGEFTVGQPQFSQERMMAFHQRNKVKLPAAVLDSFVDESVTYSFNPEKL